MKAVARGEVWLVDLGYAGKTRPALVLSTPPGDQDRALITVVPHTTSVRGTKWEISIATNYLDSGAFDVQGLASVALAKLIRRLGVLQPTEISAIETIVRTWLVL